MKYQNDEDFNNNFFFENLTINEATKLALIRIDKKGDEKLMVADKDQAYMDWYLNIMKDQGSKNFEYKVIQYKNPNELKKYKAKKKDNLDPDDPYLQENTIKLNLLEQTKWLSDIDGAGDHWIVEWEWDDGHRERENFPTEQEAHDAVQQQHTWNKKHGYDIRDAEKQRKKIIIKRKKK